MKIIETEDLRRRKYFKSNYKNNVINNKIKITKNKTKCGQNCEKNFLSKIKILWNVFSPLQKLRNYI